MVRIKVRRSIFIHRSAEEIFACLSDIEHMIGWSNALVSIQKKTPGATCPGTIVQGALRVFDGYLEMVFEVVEYEPHCYLFFKSISGCAPCLFYYQLEPEEGSGTVLSVGVDLQLIEGDLDVEESAITHEIHRQVICDLQTLKEMLETQAELR